MSELRNGNKLQCPCLQKNRCEMHYIAAPTHFPPFPLFISTGLAKLPEFPLSDSRFRSFQKEGRGVRALRVAATATSSHVNAWRIYPIHVFHHLFLSKRTWHVSLSFSLLRHCKSELLMRLMLEKWQTWQSLAGARPVCWKGEEGKEGGREGGLRRRRRGRGGGPGVVAAAAAAASHQSAWKCYQAGLNVENVS